MTVLNDSKRRSWLGEWIAVCCAVVGLQVTASVLPGTTPLWVSPTALFWIVVVAASLCVVSSAAVVVVAARGDLAEVGLLGAFAMAISALPLVHGITVPGIIYGPNDATMSSIFWALPVASLALLPLVAPRSAIGKATLRNWRSFVGIHLTASLGLATALLVHPSLLPFPKMSSPVAIGAAVASLSVCGLLSARQLRLAWISRSSCTRPSRW